jgi:hypothetical protein
MLNILLAVAYDVAKAYLFYPDHLSFYTLQLG